MMTAHSKRLARLVAGAFVLLVAEVLIAPGAAWAGCNHLVHPRSDMAADARGLDAMIVAGAPAPGVPHTPANHAPCSGLGCSSRDPLPVSSTVVADARFYEQGCSQRRLAFLNFPARAFRAPHETFFVSEGEPTSIFHPPRV
jgi:hypothetical protein